MASGFFDDFGGWLIIVIFFIFLVFQECLDEIEIADWIPFLILLLILCTCNDEC